ncbi:MAG: SDR family NAD(P)-dependent oxidoreductase, partial [Candidatus Saccharibacteria bacterium]|nr:SDR family NAD(P)-dependent oxidoreductase [Pseudorhodobacter sp.]
MTDVVLITGAGIGIGRASAKAFAKAGYHVVVTDVLAAEGASVVAEVVAEGGTGEFHLLDVRWAEAAGAL